MVCGQFGVNQAALLNLTGLSFVSRATVRLSSILHVMIHQVNLVSYGKRRKARERKHNHENFTVTKVSQLAKATVRVGGDHKHAGQAA